MSDKNRSSMPMSTAGLVRYFESEKEMVKLKPMHVAGICIGLVALEILLKLMI
jgi:preprotein translocase subunit Sec61beta